LDLENKKEVVKQKRHYRKDRHWNP